MNSKIISLVLLLSLFFAFSVAAPTKVFINTEVPVVVDLNLVDDSFDSWGALAIFILVVLVVVFVILHLKNKSRKVKKKSIRKVQRKSYQGSKRK